MKASVIALALVAAGSAAPAFSQSSVVSEKQISLDLAHDIALSAVRACRKDGYAVAVAVVDRSGQLKALLRDDNAGPHTGDTSRRKAYTALTFKRPSTELTKAITNTPAMAGMKDISDVVALGGGMPIRSGNEVIGGMGVAGAPGGDKDDACANAALSEWASRLQ